MVWPPLEPYHNSNFPSAGPLAVPSSPAPRNGEPRAKQHSMQRSPVHPVTRRIPASGLSSILSLTAASGLSIIHAHVTKTGSSCLIYQHQGCPFSHISIRFTFLGLCPLSYLSIKELLSHMLITKISCALPQHQGDSFSCLSKIK
jgi:hypothetical protein